VVKVSLSASALGILLELSPSELAASTPRESVAKVFSSASVFEIFLELGPLELGTFSQ
jgi:hypothetical protein